MSSISAVSGLGAIYNTASTSSSQGNNLFGDFEQLASSLQSGNLTNAQQAYSSLAALIKNVPSNSPTATAFKALGQALQSGNLQGAQQAFATLQQDVTQVIQGAFGGHHHHGGGGGAGELVQLLSTNTDNTAASILTPNTDSSGGASTEGGFSSQTNSSNTLLNLLA
jgi:hypothetical protein